MSKTLKRIARTFENQAGARQNDENAIPKPRKRVRVSRDLMVEIKVARPDPSRSATALGTIMVLEKYSKPKL